MRPKLWRRIAVVPHASVIHRNFAEIRHALFEIVGDIRHFRIVRAEPPLKLAHPASGSRAFEFHFRETGVSGFA